MKMFTHKIYVLVGLAVLAAGCSTMKQPAASAPGPELRNTPVVRVETALLTTEAAALRQELYRIATGLRAIKTRIAALSEALDTSTSAEASAHLRGQREALLVAAVGLRDAKTRVDKLVAGLPEQDEEVKQLRATLATEQERLQKQVANLTAEMESLRAAATAAEEIPALRKKLEQALQAQQKEQAEAAERERKAQASQTAEQERLQGQLAALNKEVERLRPLARESDDVADLKKQLTQTQRQREREQEIAAEREKKIRALREALSARDAQMAALAAATPAPAPVPEPAPAPAPAPEPAPVVEPVAAVVEPSPVSEPASVLVVEPQPIPDVAAEPVAEPVTEPAVEPAAEPAVDPTPTVVEEPVVAATPEPEPAPIAAEPALTPVQQVAAANVALQQGNLARAMTLFSAALAADESLVGARIGLAACAYSMDDLITARGHIDEVLADDARNAQALGLRAIVNWKEGRMVEADDDSARAVSGAPSDAQLRNYRGIILHALGRTTAAADEMREAVKLDPGNGEAMLNLAILLASSRPPDVEGAATWYNKALSLGVARDEGLDRLLRAKKGTP